MKAISVPTRVRRTDDSHAAPLLPRGGSSDSGDDTVSDHNMGPPASTETRPSNVVAQEGLPGPSPQLPPPPPVMENDDDTDTSGQTAVAQHHIDAPAEMYGSLKFIRGMAKAKGQVPTPSVKMYLRNEDSRMLKGAKRGVNIPPALSGGQRRSSRRRTVSTSVGDDGACRVSLQKLEELLVGSSTLDSDGDALASPAIVPYESSSSASNSGIRSLATHQLCSRAALDRPNPSGSRKSTATISTDHLCDDDDDSVVPPVWACPSVSFIRRQHPHTAATGKPDDSLPSLGSAGILLGKAPVWSRSPLFNSMVSPAHSPQQPEKTPLVQQRGSPRSPRQRASPSLQRPPQPLPRRFPPNSHTSSARSPRARWRPQRTNVANNNSNAHASLDHPPQKQQRLPPAAPVVRRLCEGPKRGVGLKKREPLSPPHTARQKRAKIKPPLPRSNARVVQKSSQERSATTCLGSAASPPTAVGRPHCDTSATSLSSSAETLICSSAPRKHCLLKNSVASNGSRSSTRLVTDKRGEAYWQQSCIDEAKRDYRVQQLTVHYAAQHADAYDGDGSVADLIGASRLRRHISRLPASGAATAEAGAGYSVDRTGAVKKGRTGQKTPSGGAVQVERMGLVLPGVAHSPSFRSCLTSHTTHRYSGAVAAQNRIPRRSCTREASGLHGRSSSSHRHGPSTTTPEVSTSLLAYHTRSRQRGRGRSNAKKWRELLMDTLEDLGVEPPAVLKSEQKAGKRPSLDGTPKATKTARRNKYYVLEEDPLRYLLDYSKILKSL